MYIHEAVAVARKEQRGIARLGTEFGRCAVFYPTDSPRGCAIVVDIPGKPIHEEAFRWQPRAKDLIADDWIVAGDARPDLY